jgi:uncharacterized protein (TIGR00369 family)
MKIPIEEHFARLERMYHRAPINRFYEPKLSIVKEAATLTIQLRPEMHHAAGAVHGSVYFKALDDAAFFAANSMVTDVFILTVQFNLYLLRPIVEGTLTARGRLTHRSGRLFFADSELQDQDGNRIAHGNGTFARSSIALNEETGYL